MKSSTELCTSVLKAVREIYKTSPDYVNQTLLKSGHTSYEVVQLTQGTALAINSDKALKLAALFGLLNFGGNDYVKGWNDAIHAVRDMVESKKI